MTSKVSGKVTESVDSVPCVPFIKKLIKKTVDISQLKPSDMINFLFLAWTIWHIFVLTDQLIYPVKEYLTDQNYLCLCCWAQK